MPNLEQEVGSWDSVLLENLSEDNFISNLQQRYRRDQIFTYIGTFLVCINPFKPLSLYSDDYVQAYATKRVFQLPPHIFGVANFAYQWMLDHNDDQCIVFSGESGSGKTDAAQKVVQYLTEVAEIRANKQQPSHITAVSRQKRSNSIQHSSSDSKTNSKPTTPIHKSSSINLPEKCILKMRSVDDGKFQFSSLRKCSHEKTVEFDFSARPKSTENLSNKCQKHLNVPAAANHICPKHNQMSPHNTRSPVIGDRQKSPTKMCNSCLRKSNSDLSRSTETFSGATKKIASPIQTKKSVDSQSACIPSVGSISSRMNVAEMNPTASGTASTSGYNCNPRSTQMSPVRALFNKKRLPAMSRTYPLASTSTKIVQGIIAKNNLLSKNTACETIKEKIAMAEVFLQAMGNATTTSNEDSSRYGKFFDIEFDFKGDPAGAHVSHYMLEKSRVTHTKLGERNFHIFYQLLSGSEIQFLKSLKLQRNIDKYEMLKNGCPREEDKLSFPLTKKSLEILGLTSDEILSVFKILASIIKLGNLTFVPSTNIDGTEGCTISNEYELEETSQLLHVESRNLINCLSRSDVSWSQIDIGNELDAPQAIARKSLLCRTLYGRLFTWLVNRINDALKSKQFNKGRSFGILDFSGFEVLDNNHFEQLAINYCNERLHQNFLRNVLKYNQDLYVREGLEWSRIDFFDNENICELIDKANFGVLSILEESQIVNDEAFFTRLHQCCAGHPNFLSHESPATNCFQIRHFASPITYSTKKFLEKNSDILPRNISHGLYQSKMQILQTLFPEGNPKRTAKRPTTVGSNLRTSLQTLLSTIGNRKCHHVFCVKPNESKRCRHFELPLVQHQVRYMSLMPLANLWRSGFCFNMTHNKFLNRYKLLNRLTWPHYNDGSTFEGISIILRGIALPNAEFVFGIRRIFIRSPRTVSELEDLRREKLDYLAILIQKTFRCYYFRKKFVRMRESQITIACAWRTWRECRFGIPFVGQRHLWGLYRMAQEEYRLVKYRKQVEWAVGVIQRHYVQWKRRQFLLTLPLRLPPDSMSPLSVQWPTSPKFLAESSHLLRTIYHRWRCLKYRLSFDQTSRNRMREKVTASIIFKDRKASYARSVAHPFVGDYVRLRQNIQWKKISVDTNDQYVVFADIIMKITRSNGKFVPILLVLSTSSMLLLDQRTLQVKYRVPASEIYRLSLSPYLDDIAVFHVKADKTCTNLRDSHDSTGCLFQSEAGRKKGDFVFQTGHVIEIVTKLFLVIQNATAKPPEIHISSEFEANFNQQTVIFTYKYSGITEVHQIQPKVTRKANRMEIIV